MGIFMAIATMTLGSGLVFSQAKVAGWSTGYHTTWGKQSTANINYKAYTHVMYFSGSINPPSASTGKSFSDIVHKNNSKAILCIGGWGAAGSFESSSNSAGNRASFITKMVDGMKNGGFDGIDIDWEEEGGGISNNYTLLLQELRTALNKLSPKPLLTIATADNQVASAVATKDYVDQMNAMSYWTLAGGMAGYMKKFTDKGVPKSVLGVGYGYDTDGEVDVNNPGDIDLKCKFAIDNGYGGIMVWEIANACAACDETTIKYVDKNFVTGVHPNRAAKTAYYKARTLSIVNNAVTGIREIYYSPASEIGSPTIKNKVFDMQGGLIATLALPRP
jgi:GH18 family chitinase